MSAMDFDLLRRLVVDALDVGPEARVRFLQERCTDPALFEAACKLLQHDTSRPTNLGEDDGPGGGADESHLDGVSRIGRYPVSRRIAAGGMGVVYLATDPTLGREIAIKRLPEWLIGESEALDRLREEARNLAQLTHPHIATVYSLETDGDNPFLTMEFVPGESLSAVLSREPLDVDGTLRVMRGVAGALEAAHAKGIAHRDLKPHNIMVTDRGEAKVLDFGLSVRFREFSEGMGIPLEAPRSSNPDNAVDASGEHNVSPTRHDVYRVAPGDEIQDAAKSPLSWSSAGTPGYMSPERIRGEGGDIAGDAWSFGCVLFECLSGVRAFGGSREERIAKTLRDSAPMSALPSLVPPPLPRLIEECLVKDPSDRLVSMRTARRIIETLMERRERDRLDALQRRADPRSHLPHYLNRFVGREQEVDSILARLGQHRLVTLVGLGGCGKTRLAVEALLRSGHDAIWVDLGALENPDQVSLALLTALEVPAPDRDPVRQLSQILADKDVVVLMDNCEHLIEACRDLLVPILRQCIGVRVLATSREPLEITGEAVIFVEPLPLPGPGQPVLKNASVQLFLDRARNLSSTVDSTEAGAMIVEDICRRLEGIPLALEIAASQLDVLSIRELKDRLEQRFELSQAPHDGRHHSVRAVIDSSFQRLHPLEQTMLARMSVFPGTWTLEAAEAVGLTDVDTPWRAFELVKALARKSLVQRVHASEIEAPSRFRVLETVAHFARGKLQASGEERSANEAMIRFYRDMLTDRDVTNTTPIDGQEREADRLDSMRKQNGGSSRNEGSGPDRTALAMPVRTGAHQRPQRWELSRLFRVEEDNVSRALDAAAQHLPADQHARFVLAVTQHWLHCGRHEEGRRRCRAALAALDRDGNRDPSFVGGLLLAHSALSLRASELDEGRATAERAQELAIEHADPHLLTRALHALASIERRRDRLPEALELCDRALAVTRPTQDPSLEASIRFNRGVTLLHLARTAEAEAEIRASLTAREVLGDETELSESINALGVVFSVRGDYESARRHYEESLVIKRRIQHPQGLVTSFLNLSRVTVNLFRSLEHDRDLLEQSRSYSEEGIAMARQIGDGVGLAALYLARASAESMFPELEAAETAARLGLETARAFGSVRNEAAGYDILAKLAIQRGAFGEAESLGASAFTLFLKGEPISVYQPLRTLARARFGHGDAFTALTCLAASRIAADRASTKHSPRDEQVILELEARVTAQLDEASIRHAKTVAETTPLEQFLEKVLGAKP